MQGQWQMFLPHHKHVGGVGPKVLQSTRAGYRISFADRVPSLICTKSAMKFELTDDGLLRTHGVLATAFGLQLGLAPRASHDLFMGSSAAVRGCRAALRS